MPDEVGQLGVEPSDWENLARELDHHADTLTRAALYFRERARIAREKAQVIRDAH